MDHTNHVRLTTDELKPAILEGAAVYGADDHKVGKVGRVRGSGAASSVVIDIGGLLGIGAKPVSVSISDLDFMRDEEWRGPCPDRMDKGSAEADARTQRLDGSPSCRNPSWLALGWLLLPEIGNRNNDGVRHPGT